MKIMSRDFTLKEKIVLILLAVVLLGTLYYFVVDQPVRRAIAETTNEREDLQIQLSALQIKMATLNKMKSELTTLTGDAAFGEMGSYNNSAAELNELNQLLQDTTGYDISFDSVTRDGDLVRRTFSLTFTASDYDKAEDLITKLCEGEWRCLVSEITFNSPDSDLSKGAVNVGLKATFYETMADGTADSGLPEDTSSDSQEVTE